MCLYRSGIIHEIHVGVQEAKGCVLAVTEIYFMTTCDVLCCAQINLLTFAHCRDGHAQTRAGKPSGSAAIRPRPLKDRQGPALDRVHGLWEAIGQRRWFVGCQRGSRRSQKDVSDFPISLRHLPKSFSEFRNASVLAFQPPPYPLR